MTTRHQYRTRISNSGTPDYPAHEIMCPACNATHSMSDQWAGGFHFNGNYTLPTFRPALRVESKGNDGADSAICFSLITDGRIQYSKDSTHRLAGRTVELPALDHNGISEPTS